MTAGLGPGSCQERSRGCGIAPTCVSWDVYLSGLPTIGFLHTSAVHTPTFDALLNDRKPRLSSATVVAEALLSDARELGSQHQRVVNGIEAALDQLEHAGASVILCTCSTIGGVAEDVGRSRRVPVVRVDRAMAASAVQQGPRIGVVAAIESTLEPTRELIESVASDLAVPVEITCAISQGAWERFEVGDLDGYLGRVVATCAELESHCDVVVLAQASMAGAAERANSKVPILSSPRLAVDEVVARFGGRAWSAGNAR